MFQVDLPSDIVMNLNLPVIYYLLVKSIFFVLVKVFFDVYYATCVVID